MKLKKIVSFLISAAAAWGVMGFSAVHAQDNVVLKKNILETAFSADYNLYANNYSRWSSIVNSYICENDDRTISVIRYSYADSCVYAEDYSAENVLLKSRKIENELPIFAGFYSGSDGNYLVFGQSNNSESSSTEVMRVVKYSKSWERLASFSVKGANTKVPFDAGSLRMCESNGVLYVHTCHTMFKSSTDGRNHQANMIFAIDTAAMTAIDSYYKVMNISYGYVSHSFNQFIESDGEYVYRVDHGDAYIRGISVTKFREGDSVTSVSYTNAFPIQGTTGDNYTGVSVGGFELSDDNCLIVCNSVDQSSAAAYSESRQRNIFLTVTDKNLGNTKTVQLTNYPEGSVISPQTPQLVKYGSDRFMIMWREYNSSDYYSEMKILMVDGKGNALSGIKTAKFDVSDCQPVVTSDNLIKWYVSDNDEISIYSIDPYALETSDEDFVFVNGDESIGDVNFDGAIDLKDATVVLMIYSYSAAGLSLDEFPAIQQKAADFNKDGDVNIQDAAEILNIYSRNAAGL